MANVKEYLKKILEARYGKDVRQSIHDSIDAINTQVTESEEAIEEAAEQASTSAQTASQAAISAEASAARAEEAAEEAEKGADGIDFDNDTRTLSLKKGEEVLDTAEIPGGDVPDIVTSWGNPTSDSKVPSEKLVKDTLDSKIDKDDLSEVATSGSYDDLSDKPTIPSEVTESTVSGWGFTKNTGTYTKPSGGIPKTDLASDIQTKLDSARVADRYDSDLIYDVGEIVYYDDFLYMCIKSCTNVLPTNTTYWKPYANISKVVSELNSNLTQLIEYKRESITSTGKTITITKDGILVLTFRGSFYANNDNGSHGCFISLNGNAVFSDYDRLLTAWSGYIKECGTVVIPVKVGDKITAGLTMTISATQKTEALDILSMYGAEYTVS